MPFFNSEGKEISKEDALVFRKLNEAMFDGYVGAIKSAQRLKRDRAYYAPILEQLNASKALFIEHFNQALNSEKETKADDFLKAEFEALYPAILEKADPTKTEQFEEFNSRLGDHFSGFLHNSLKKKDTAKGFQASVGSFKLTETSFPGIENIAPYNPHTDSLDILADIRKGNSTTYEVADSAKENEQTLKDMYGYRGALSLSREKSAKLMDKETVTVSDLFEAFSSFNKLLRPNETNGGALRGISISYGVKDEGILPIMIPSDLFKTLSIVSDKINLIKKTEDPNLRKSQAVQLASFAYQMLVSEHIFEDGNGRTCRIFADTVLQAFGLPPHTPNLGLVSTGGTIGNKLDFEKGTKLFLEGITVSDEVLKMEREAGPAGLGEQAKKCLDGANISHDILEKVSPKKAISFATKARVLMCSLLEGMDDFIKSDHFMSWNSNQYGIVKEKAKDLKECLSANAINSSKAREAFQHMRDAIKEYEAHCRRHPKNGDTRRERMSAVFRMGETLTYMENQARQLTKIEAGIAIEKIQDALVSGPDPGNPREAAAKYIAVRNLELEVKGEHLSKSMDEIRDHLQLKEETVNAVMNVLFFDTFVERTFKKPGFQELSKEDKFKLLNDSFDVMRKEAMAEKQRISRERYLKHLREKGGEPSANENRNNANANAEKGNEEAAKQKIVPGFGK